MSIKNLDKENKLEVPITSTKSLSKHLSKGKHINSRNIKSPNLSNANSQFSTKEGTPNKDNIAECKTIEVGYNNNDFDNVSLASSSDKLSNITKLLNQNDYNYSNIKEKIPNSVNDSDKFVYNMLYKTTSLRTEKMLQKVNIVRPISPRKTNFEQENNNSKPPTKSNRKAGVNNKEKISCCFFFKK